jgi:hypothetical protein
MEATIKGIPTMNSLAPFSALRTAVFTTISLAKWRGIAGAVLLATASANAADLVWIGGTGNWNAAAN